MDKIDLSDFSAVIPVKVDHQDRIDNLNTVLGFFEKYFNNYEIIILEHDNEQKCAYLENKKNVVYSFNKSNGLLHRTHMLNEGMRMSNRRFVSSYDTDVIFHPRAIEEALKLLRNGCAYVFPYNGVFIDLTNHLKRKYVETLDHDALPLYDSSVKLYTKGQDYHVIHNRGLGGAVFFEKETFLKYGGYNKKFISWGYEDNELMIRFNKLGVNIQRVGGVYCLYHLCHHRSVDSSPNHEKISNNQTEMYRVNSMTRAQLETYIQNELI